MTIKSKLDARLNEFSASERRIALVVAERYPVSALGGIEDLARHAKVSAPTVTRFVRRLGYARFADFQRDVRQEVQDAEASPLALLQRHREAPPETGLLADIAASIGSLESDAIASALDVAAEMINGTKGRIFAIGGRWTSVVAQYLTFQLGTMREEVHALLPTASGIAADRLLDLSRRDVVILFDVRRYQPDLYAMAEIVREQKVRIILFTDVELSPICELAEVTIPAPVATASPLDTLAPTIAIVDRLLGLLVEASGDGASKRIARLEQVRGRIAGAAGGA
ncbi:MAG: MurR/RpiR family transcriptional regulator [Pseudomonadota bacterium]